MSVVRVTLEGDFTPEGLHRLQKQLDELKEKLSLDEDDHDVTALTPIDDSAKLEVDEQEALNVQITFVKDVFDKGGNAWRFLDAAYRLSQNGQTFTMTELAQRIGVTHKEALAFNRNIGRTAKKWTKLLSVLQQSREVGKYHLANAIAAAVRVFLNERKQP